MNQLYDTLTDKDFQISKLERELADVRDVNKELESTVSLLVHNRLSRGAQTIDTDFIKNLSASRGLLTLSKIDELLGSNLKPATVIVELLADLLLVVETRKLSYVLIDSTVVVYQRDGYLLGRSITEMGELVFDMIQLVVTILHNEFPICETRNVNGVVSVLNGLNDRENVISLFAKAIKRNKQRFI